MVVRILPADATAGAEATGAPTASSSRPPKSLRLLGRLNSHFPPPKGFRRADALRRIPWFPSWWWDDLVKKGFLEPVFEPSKEPEKSAKGRSSGASGDGPQQKRGKKQLFKLSANAVAELSQDDTSGARAPQATSQAG